MVRLDTLVAKVLADARQRMDEREKDRATGENRRPVSEPRGKEGGTHLAAGKRRNRMEAAE